MLTPLSAAVAWLLEGILIVCWTRVLVGFWLKAGSAMASRHANETALDTALTAGKTLCGTRELRRYGREETMDNIGQPFVVLSRNRMGELRGNFCEARSSDAEQLE
jgi:hypothetical protein